MIRKLILGILKATPNEDAKLSYDRREVRVSELGKKIYALGQERDLLQVKVTTLENARKRAVKVIETGVGDPEPNDSKERSEYVGLVSNFYQGILEAKLRHMIAVIREEQDTIFIGSVPEGMTRAEYDLVLKGTSNGFKLLMEWGELLSGEHVRNTTRVTNE